MSRLNKKSSIFLAWKLGCCRKVEMRFDGREIAGLSSIDLSRFCNEVIYWFQFQMDVMQITENQCHRELLKLTNKNSHRNKYSFMFIHN